MDPSEEEKKFYPDYHVVTVPAQRGKSFSFFFFFFFESFNTISSSFPLDVVFLFFKLTAAAAA